MKLTLHMTRVCNRVPAKKILQSIVVFGLASALFSSAIAQPVRPSKPKVAPTKEKSGIGGDKFVGRFNGLRFDGNAYAYLPPYLVATANSIAADLSGKNITEVRAVGKVNLKLTMTPRGGGAPVRIETKSNAATLNSAQRTLTLTGNVDGFYQLQNGARNTLRGTKATISYPANGQFTAVVEGGTGGVRIVVPASTVAGSAANSIGSVVVTARNLSINSADGTATFAGNARAISNDGASKLDVAAPSFTLRRNATNGLESLRSSGRTLLKVNLPPTTAAPAVATTSSTQTNTATSVGRPTYFEVAADSLTLLGASGGASLGTLTFDGNVSGFYRLTGEGGAVNNFPFKGSRAVIQNAASASDNFQLEITGAEISAPSFDLGF